jgi:hypothetical protein
MNERKAAAKSEEGKRTDGSPLLVGRTAGRRNGEGRGAFYAASNRRHTRVLTLEAEQRALNQLASMGPGVQRLGVFGAALQRTPRTRPVVTEEGRTGCAHCRWDQTTEANRH